MSSPPEYLSWHVLMIDCACGCSMDVIAPRELIVQACSKCGRWHDGFGDYIGDYTEDELLKLAERWDEDE